MWGGGSRIFLNIWYKPEPQNRVGEFLYFLGPNARKKKWLKLVNHIFIYIKDVAINPSFLPGWEMKYIRFSQPTEFGNERKRSYRFRASVELSTSKGEKDGTEVESKLTKYFRNQDSIDKMKKDFVVGANYDKRLIDKVIDKRSMDISATKSFLE